MSNGDWVIPFHENTHLQTIIIPDTNTAVVVLPHPALQLITLCKQRDEVVLEIEQ